MIPTVVYLFPQNTQLVQIAGLQDQVTGDYLNGATVTATLINFQGNADPVLNQIPMAYVAATNGNYEGIVPDTFNAPIGSGYVLQIQADQLGSQALWSIPAKVALRAK
jgi:hypothetical protein